jgi:major membrane immunogen (membrane-anchored lipoprotein)
MQKERKLKCNILWICLWGLLLTACGKKEDVITNLSYVATAYDLQYDYFNTEKTYQFDIDAGDTLSLQVECSDGSVDVKVVNIDNEELYHENLLVSKSVDIAIEEDGRYIVVMEGNKTTGSIHMEVKEAE